MITWNLEFLKTPISRLIKNKERKWDRVLYYVGYNNMVEHYLYLDQEFKVF